MVIRNHIRGSEELEKGTRELSGVIEMFCVLRGVRVT